MKKVYYNGTILTMESRHCPECVVTEDDTIIYVGDKKHCTITMSATDQYIDLQGKTLLPSFMEANGYFLANVMEKLELNLYSCRSITEMEQKIQEFCQHTSYQNFWVIGKNVSPELIQSGTITQEWLNSVTDHAMVLLSIDGKSAYCNKLALHTLHISTNHSQNGYIANIEPYLDKIPTYSIEELDDAIEKTTQEYFACGITTVQDGFLVENVLPLYTYVIKKDKLKLNVIGYPDFDNFVEFGDYFGNEYYHHFRLGGMSILLDGKVENQQAHTRCRNKIDDTYGYPNQSTKTIADQIEWAIQNGQPLLLHAYGDASIDQYFRATQFLSKQSLLSIPTTIVGATMIDMDQLQKLKRYHTHLAFDGLAPYQHGLSYQAMYGKQRAVMANPIHASLSKKIPTSLYTKCSSFKDIQTLFSFCATRKLPNGMSFGKKEKISCKKILQCLTIAIAKQYGEAKTTGSIAVGKKANMIILSHNPLKLKPKQWPSIQLCTTIFEGKIVYQQK